VLSAKDIATYARQIVGETANEVRLRNGVGRAYYAAYHYCQQAANTYCDTFTKEEIDQLPNNQKTTHANLFLRLKTKCRDEDNKKNLKFMADQASKMKDFRVTADYHLDKVINHDSFIRCLTHLSEVETTLTALTPTK